MRNEHYIQAKDLFLDACDLSGNERVELLDRRCADDATLRREVESLLEEYDTSSFSEGPSGSMDVAPDLAGRAPSAEPPPPRIGPYRVLHEIARGGMGVVYLGRDERLNRRVAIKVVKRGMDTDEVLGRFRQERRLLAALNHPGIARLYDGGETDDGLPYFVMEFVEGQAIDEYCDTHRLSIVERLELFRSVCAAVHHAHQNLVAHRDIKPGNILIDGQGAPKLLDFGIAKLINPEISSDAGDPTRPELRFMTPEYASPEQVRGNPITTGSDVYSLGVLLYELVCGHRPYQLRGHARSEIERLICETDPDKPSTAVSRIEQGNGAADPETSSTITPESVSMVRESRPDRLRRRLAGDIDNIVLMALRKEPRRRYASAEQFSDDIRRHIEGLPVRACPETVGYRLSKFVRRHRLGVAAAAVIVLTLIAGIAGTTWQARIAAANARVAEAQRDQADRRFDQLRALAHTFLFDFHDEIVRLEGSLPARELLVDTAVAYLEGLRDEVGDDPELIDELAAGYVRVGDIRGGIRNPARGDTEAALEHYLASLELRRALLERAGGVEDDRLRQAVSVSLLRIGDIQMRTSRVGAARASFDAAAELRRARLEEAPDDPARRRGLAYALNVVAAAMSRQGDLDGALRQYGRSLELRESVAAAEPGDPRRRRDLSTVHTHLGATREKIGELEMALEHYHQAIAIRRPLAEADDTSGRARRDLAVARGFAGRALLKLGRPDDAGTHLEHFLEVAERQVEASPGDARVEGGLADAHGLMSELLVEVGDLAGARRHAGAMAAIGARLAAADPSNTYVRRIVMRSDEQLAAVDRREGALDAAVEHLAAALLVAERLAAADPDDLRVHEDRARITLDLGRAMAEAGNVERARRRLDEAAAQFEALSERQPRHAATRTGLADARRAQAQLAAGG